MKVIKPNELSSVDGSFSRASTGTYFDSTFTMQTAAINAPRFNYNPTTQRYEGLLVEPAATNLLLNSASLSTQTVTVTDATNYTFSFYGTGTVVLTGAHSATVVGTGTYPHNRVALSFTSTTTSLTLTVSGTVEYAQLETGLRATSYIPTTSTAVTRSADVITGSGLIYSTATDPNSAWSSATTYATGAKVRYLNKLWESLQNANTNNTPSTSPLWWLDLGADNIHAAFDVQVSTATTATTELTFVVKPGGITAIDSVALINLDTAVVRIGVSTVADGVTYSGATGISSAEIFDWYDYFFTDPFVRRTQVIFQDIPKSIDSVVTVRLESQPSIAVSIAQAIFGSINQIGGTQYGASAGITDYSKKETDEFGTTTFIERAYSKRLSASVFLRNTELNRIQNLLYGIRAKPSVWIATDDPLFEEAAIVYGFYRDFSTDIAYPSHSLCRLEIEGLT